MSERGRRNILTGEVISNKMDKSLSVLIYNLVKHPKYKKYIKRSSVFKVHDEDNKAQVGDKVRIFETRALSKTKRWKLLDFVSKKESSQKPLSEKSMSSGNTNGGKRDSENNITGQSKENPEG